MRNSKQRINSGGDAITGSRVPEGVRQPTTTNNIRTRSKFGISQGALLYFQLSLSLLSFIILTRNLGIRPMQKKSF